MKIMKKITKKTKKVVTTKATLPVAGCTLTGFTPSSAEQLGDDSEAGKQFKRLTEFVTRNYPAVSLPLLFSLRGDIEIADMQVLFKNWTTAQVKLGKLALVQGPYDSDVYRVL